jgi:hypothetical protein
MIKRVHPIRALAKVSVKKNDSRSFLCRLIKPRAVDIVDKAFISVPTLVFLLHYEALS